MAKYISAKFKTKCPDKAKRIPLTHETIKEMAEGLVKYLIDRELFNDVRVYYNIGCDYWRTLTCDIYREQDMWEQVKLPIGKKGQYIVYQRDDLTPHEFFEYNGKYLSMSFEGALYHELNYGSYYGNTLEHLRNYFSWYGLHIEQGYAWSLTCYEI